MNLQIKSYLKELKKELRKADVATIHDAISDAEEHLTSGLENALLENPEANEEDIFEKLVEEYGSPVEIAKAYQDIEERVRPALYFDGKLSGKNIFLNFFLVVTDPKAWGAVLYLLISFITGMVYFTWAVFGLSISFTLSVFIFGIPIAILLLLSMRWWGLLEGRIVESLLGVRMPRRIAYFPKETHWKKKLGSILSARSTWTIPLYMILQLFLGSAYLLFFAFALSLSFSFLIGPILFVMGIPFLETTGFYYNQSGINLVFMFLGGFFIPPATLHIAKFIGKYHGKLAKFLLVND